jgi:tetratricopeptide (TPR) repeat protein
MPIFVDFRSKITDQLLKESAPVDSQSAVFFGEILKSRAKDLEAETYFRLAAEVGDPKGAVELGLALQRRGKNLEAITWLMQSAVSDLNSRVHLARALASTGREREAEEALDNALNFLSEEDLRRSHHFFAWEYSFVGCWPKAIEKFELAHRNSENTAAAIADHYIRLGEEDKAKRWIEDTREKGNAEFADMLEGDYLFAKGKFKEAIRSYSKVTSLKSKGELLEEFDVQAGIRIASTYKAWGNSKEVDRWTSDDAGILDGANALAFSGWWTNSLNVGIVKYLVDDTMKRVTDLDTGLDSTNAMCNWGISDFRFGNLESAIEKLESALNALDGSSESEASFFLMHAYAELGRIEDSAEMKRRCDASGGYEPSEIDRKRLGME